MSTTLAPNPVTADADTTSSIRHAHCTACQPVEGEVVALCGARKHSGPPPVGEDPRCLPPDACVVCVDIFTAPCGRCGR